MADVALYFYVVGVGGAAKEVPINYSHTISNLQAKIKTKMEPRLNHLAASQLTLYSVNLDNDSDKLTTLKRAEDATGAKKLTNSSKKISECFGNVNGGRVRVLVQLPDNDGESLGSRSRYNQTN